MMKQPFLLIVLLVLLLTGAGLTAYRDRLPLSGGGLITARGYSGILKIALNKDSRGQITGLDLVEHHETPAYIGNPSAFLGQFIGKGPGDPLTLGHDIDGISRATITSAAITAAVHRAVKGQGSPPSGNTDAGRFLLIILPPLALLALALVSFFRRSEPLRWAAMLFSCLYFGLITRSMFSVTLAANAGLLNTPSPLIDPRGWTILLIALIPSLVIARLYCSSLCPFAFIEETLGAFARKFIPATRRHDGALPGFEPVRVALLFLALSLSFFAGNSSPAASETFLTLFTVQGTGAAWAILGMVLAASLFHFRFWCRYICPAGALLNMLSTFAPFQAGRDHACRHPHACAVTCTGQCLTPVTGSSRLLTAAIILTAGALLVQIGDATREGGPSAAMAADEADDPLRGERLKKDLATRGLKLHPAEYWKEVK